MSFIRNSLIRVSCIHFNWSTRIINRLRLQLNECPPKSALSLQIPCTFIFSKCIYKFVDEESDNPFVMQWKWWVTDGIHTDSYGFLWHSMLLNCSLENSSIILRHVSRISYCIRDVLLVTLLVLFHIICDNKSSIFSMEQRTIIFPQLLSYKFRLKVLTKKMLSFTFNDLVIQRLHTWVT